MWQWISACRLNSVLSSHLIYALPACNGEPNKKNVQSSSVKLCLTALKRWCETLVMNQATPYLTQLCNPHSCLHQVTHSDDGRTHTEKKGLFIIPFTLKGNILCLNWLWKWGYPVGNGDRGLMGPVFPSIMACWAARVCSMSTQQQASEVNLKALVKRTACFLGTRS